LYRRLGGPQACPSHGETLYVGGPNSNEKFF
jgi:hypothetical protein